MTLKATKYTTCILLCLNRANQVTYHIGLVADFTGRCPDSDCERICPSCATEKYRCPGCRHRWKWIDGSPTPSDQARGVFDNWHPNHPYQDSSEAYKCGVVQSVNSAMAWYSRPCGDLVTPYICKRGMSTSWLREANFKPTRATIRVIGNRVES